MRRKLLAAAIMAAALFGAAWPAQAATAIKMVTPDWHYRWHEGRWWYWMPQNQWMVWTGSTWVPSEQFSKCPMIYSVGQVSSQPIAERNAENGGESITPEPAYSGGGQSTYYSGGSGSNYAGYGWNWGPGTAYRNGPGARF